MRRGKNTICGICSKIIKPGGIGGHMRLAHGIRDLGEKRFETSQVSGDVCRDVRQNEYEVAAIKFPYKGKIINESSSNDNEPEYKRLANHLRKNYRLIHSIKAQSENQLDDKMKIYISNNNMSNCYLQKHKVTENYWCCWVWILYKDGV